MNRYVRADVDGRDLGNGPDRDRGAPRGIGFSRRGWRCLLLGVADAGMFNRRGRKMDVVGWNAATPHCRPGHIARSCRMPVTYASSCDAVTAAASSRPSP